MPGLSPGLGHARHADAFAAGRSAARQALAALPDGKPAWALCFAGGQHDADELLRGLRSELGELPVLGGCGTGVIHGGGAGCSGYECGLLLFPQGLAPAALLCVDGLDEDETAAGRRLGAGLRELALPPEASVLLLYDSIRSAPPPVLHLGSRLLDGICEGLGATQPQLWGAGTLADMNLSGSYVFDGQRARRHVAVAVVLPLQLQGHLAIMHGCLPASDFLEITRIEGPRVLELDGRPALQVVEERLGMPRAELLARRPLPALTLGEKHAPAFSPFSEGQYVNRLVVALDPVEESLVLFEADFRAGSRVQLMAYEPWRMIESAREQTRALLADLPAGGAAFALYIDCAGRSTAFSGMEADETTPVRQQLEGLCPLLGLYSGVEIAPFLGRARPLDWTGVLAVFTWRN